MTHNDIAINVENISKRYRIGLKESMHDSIGGAVLDYLRSPLKNYRKYRSLYRFDDSRSEMHSEAAASDIIWALKDVSFEVKKGEVLGVIGRNGAGKSTLLKILSRITEPTSGRATIKGKVSSLLEVGTGFHPELTGRDNIYLNGTVLGMRKKEVDGKFNEIIEFSGVKKFIDTPVKRYSSGMKVRLAFAVAAHLEPEILIIDEVLAVGDAEFQKKCLGKMHDFTEGGRTVLFVSHNMGAVMDLCPRSILLRDGQVAASGESRTIIEQYLSTMFNPVDNLDLSTAEARKGDGRLKFRAAYLEDRQGRKIQLPISGQPINIVLEYENSECLSNVQFLLTIFNQMGVAVTHCNIRTNGNSPHLSKGMGKAVCRIPRLPLPLGNYKIAIAANDQSGTLDAISTACIFDIETSNFFKNSYTPPMRYSTALIDHEWDIVNH